VSKELELVLAVRRPPTISSEEDGVSSYREKGVEQEHRIRRSRDLGRAGAIEGDEEERSREGAEGARMVEAGRAPWHGQRGTRRAEERAREEASRGGDGRSSAASRGGRGDHGKAAAGRWAPSAMGEQGNCRAGEEDEGEREEGRASNRENSDSHIFLLCERMRTMSEKNEEGGRRCNTPIF
jgi:hypothetical protein